MMINNVKRICNGNTQPIREILIQNEYILVIYRFLIVIHFDAFANMMSMATILSKFT